MNQANDEKVNLLLKDCDKFGAVDEQTIKMAEQELEVIFPYQYREFLANFGAVVGYGFEIYGLPHQEASQCPYWQNVVTIAKKLRKNNQIGAENKMFIPISHDGMDAYYFINTECFNKAEIWSIDYLREYIVSFDLYDFIEMLTCKG